jgi:hypothetical protein
MPSRRRSSTSTRRPPRTRSGGALVPAKRFRKKGKKGKKERVVATSGRLTVTEVAELDQLRKELERTARGTSPLRWNANPDDVQRSVAQLVLTLVEFIRQLLERQAIRRMEAGTLNEGQTEEVGQALMKLEETVRDIAAKFGLSPDELNLDLGPVGKLM